MSHGFGFWIILVLPWVEEAAFGPFIPVLKQPGFMENSVNYLDFALKFFVNKLVADLDMR